jgi:hypothetical protein
MLLGNLYLYLYLTNKLKFTIMILKGAWGSVVVKALRY